MSQDKRPVRVVHVLASLVPGGLENGVVNIINVADRSRVEHSVVCLDEAGAFAERLPRDVRIEVVGRRPGLDLRGMVRAARIVRSLAPDIVHTRNWATLLEGAFAARASGARLIHGLHGRTFQELGGGVSWKRRLLEGRTIRKRAARLIVLLPSLVAETTELGIAPERVTVIENGVDLARFKPDPEARQRVRDELGAKPKDVVVGCVARLDPVKDHPTLFRAFAKLGDKALLVLVGDGPRRASLERLARIDGLGPRVRFLGHRSNPAALYPGFDIFALASKYEGSSNTVLEAMACGLPVVATATGGNEGLVTPRTGVLVPVGEPDALGQALGQLGRDAKKRAAMGAAALEAARERSLERMARRYEALYLEVASGVVPAPAPALVSLPGGAVSCAGDLPHAVATAPVPRAVVSLSRAAAGTDVSRAAAGTDVSLPRAGTDVSLPRASAGAPGWGPSPAPGADPGTLPPAGGEDSFPTKVAS